MLGLQHLPTDALHHLFTFLNGRDVAALGCVCSFLRDVSTQECVWEDHCESWLSAQRLVAPSAPRAPALLAATALPSYRALFTALHALGSWPEGLFYCTTKESLPRGHLLVGLLDPGTGRLRMLEPRPRRLAGPPPSPDDAWELNPYLSIDMAPGSDGAQAGVSVTSASGLHFTLQLGLDGTQLSVHISPVASSPPRGPPPLPGVRTVQPSREQAEGDASQQLARLAAHLGVTPDRFRMHSVGYERVPAVGELERQAVPGEPPGMALLRRCQGVYFGSYGPHGLEVLSLRACAQEGDAPPLCPVTGPRLQALKLRGDPNVPALKHSFVVDAASMRPGPYDPATDDPFAPEGGPDRPCLSFWHGAHQLVSLEDRPVAARFRAVGCINVVPGDWDPEWVPATFLLYHPPMHRTLTVIFEDEDQPFRHAIDYLEVPFGGQPEL